MITSTLTTAEEIYEIVSFEFKDGVPLSTQQESMEILNRLVAASKGLKSRQFYYSSKDNRWIDIVVWDSEENAAAAAAHVMNNPEASMIFGSMQQDTMIFSHYKQVGGMIKN
jgi:hypothetical protein